MTTDKQATAMGFLLPRGTDPITNGDNVISSNAKTTTGEILKLRDRAYYLENHPPAQGPQGPPGLPGVNAVPADTAVAAYVTTPGAQSRAAVLDAAAGGMQTKRYPDPVNLTALETARNAMLMCRRAPIIITCVTDSIGWGVGVDGLDASTTGALSPQQDIYRENAWPYQLAAALNNPYGLPPVNGWLGPGYTSDVSTWAAATSALLSNLDRSQGPFGYQTGSNRGGAIIRHGGYSEWNTNTLTRPFTELDVLVWAGPEFADAGFPSIFVDGAKVYTGGLPTGGVTSQLSTITVTGLTNKRHTVRVTNDTDAVNSAGAGLNVYGGFIVPRNSSGIVVNRIGSPGATTVDAVGDPANMNRPRTINSAVIPGYSDLVIIALSTNDYLFQTPIPTFKQNIARLIDAAACPVLLLDGPPVNSVNNAIKPPEYTQQLVDLAHERATVAFAPLSALFGARADGVGRGLFATSTTVHPSWTGARAIADYVAWVLTRSYLPA